MKTWEEQGKEKVKACGQEGKCQFLLKKVEEGIIQVKHIGLKSSLKKVVKKSSDGLG